MSADVRSIDAIQDYLQQFQTSRAETLKEVENIQTELQRMTSWLEQDVDHYWKIELRNAERYQVECQEALLRCQSAVRADEQRPCTEQQKRLHRAKERRMFCERQVRLVAEAKLAWQRACAKLASKIFRVRDLAEADMAVAIVHLRNRLQTLEDYTQLRTTALNAVDSTPKSSSNATSPEATPTPATNMPQPSEEPT